MGHCGLLRAVLTGQDGRIDKYRPFLAQQPEDDVRTQVSVSKKLSTNGLCKSSYNDTFTRYIGSLLVANNMNYKLFF